MKWKQGPATIIMTISSGGVTGRTYTKGNPTPIKQELEAPLFADSGGASRRTPHKVAITIPEGDPGRPILWLATDGGRWMGKMEAVNPQMNSPVLTSELQHSRLG